MKKKNLLPFLLMGMMSATAIAQTDLTSSIVNPSFEADGVYEGLTATKPPTGWTITSSVDCSTFPWCGVNSDGETATKDGTYIFGFWVSSVPDFELSQTIVGLEDGLYTVTCGLMGASNSGGTRQTTQRLFANNNSLLFGSEEDYLATNLALLNEDYSFAGYDEKNQDNGPFRTMTLNVNVVGGSLTFGVRTNGDASTKGFSFTQNGAGGEGWLKVDNFTLTYLGKEAAALQLVIDQANQLIGEYMQTAQVTAIQNAITSAEAYLSSQDADVIKAQIVILNAAIETTKASIEAYAKLNDAVADAYNVGTSFDGYYYYSEFKSIFDTANAMFDAKEASTEEALSTAKSLLAVIEKCRMWGKIVAIYSSKIINASFEDNGGAVNYPTLPIGWSITDNSYSWCGVNSDADAATKTGSYVFGIWNASISGFEIFQTLTGIPNGTYRLYADMMVSATSSGSSRLGSQRIFAGDKETLYKDMYAEDNLGYDATPLHTLTVDVVVTDGTLKIGARSDSNPESSTAGSGWFKVDNFRLALVEVADVDQAVKEAQDALKVLIAEAKASQEKMAPSVKAAMLALADEAQSLIDANETDLDVLSAKSAALTQAIAAKATTVALYETFDLAIGEAYENISNYTDAYLYYNKFKDAIAKADAAYVAASYEASEINAAMSELTQLNRKCTDFEVAQADLTDSIANPSFEADGKKIDYPAIPMGWTIAFPDTVTLTWCGANTDHTGGTGAYTFGLWNAIVPEFEIGQTITGLSNGTYRVMVDMMVSATSAGQSRLGAQRLFAGAKELNYSDAWDEDFLPYDNTPLRNMSLEVEVTDGTLHLGVRTRGDVDQINNPEYTNTGVGWFKIDNFRLAAINVKGLGIEGVAAETGGHTIVSGIGFISIQATKNDKIAIYGLGGNLVKNVTLSVGENTVALPAGSYLVKNQKVIVR
ncbi:MAG: hypothetical protein KBH23_00670 [Bacteroidaceae bacterium]|nr:hypothetical protein [Bacteroidaceae bacterium]